MGPLKSLKVLELAGLAPAPLAGMILADFGASVYRVDRTSAGFSPDTLVRGKRSVALNLKTTQGIDIFKRMTQTSDVLIEPFRPGVMENLGLGPTNLMSDNKKLIYVRMNGYGSVGCMSKKAGHDINYLAISGLLSQLGPQGHNPHPPINLLADFAGGSMMAVMGILLALHNRQTSGKGQVVECSMTKGASYLSSFLDLSRANPIANATLWGGARGENLLDGGAPMYGTYETKDRKFMAVGALEPQFFAELLKGLELDEEYALDQMNREEWTRIKAVFTDKFKQKTQREWTAIFDELDACVTPVLERSEAPLHPHNLESGSFHPDSEEGSYVPTPAPTLSRTPAEVEPNSLLKPGNHSIEVMQEFGYSSEEIEKFLADGIVEQASKSKL